MSFTPEDVRYTASLLSLHVCRRCQRPPARTLEDRNAYLRENRECREAIRDGRWQSERLHFTEPELLAREMLRDIAL